MNTIKMYQDRDELDQLLHDFFKAEMPKSLPPLKLPQLPELPLRQTRQPVGFFSSRLALAASILLLALGSLFVSGAFKGLQPSSPDGHRNDTATPLVKPARTK